VIHLVLVERPRMRLRSGNSTSELSTVSAELLPGASTTTNGRHHAPASAGTFFIRLREFFSRGNFQCHLSPVSGEPIAEYANGDSRTICTPFRQRSADVPCEGLARVLFDLECRRARSSERGGLSKAAGGRRSRFPLNGSRRRTLRIHARAEDIAFPSIHIWDHGRPPRASRLRTQFDRKYAVDLHGADVRPEGRRRERLPLYHTWD